MKEKRALTDKIERENKMDKIKLKWHSDSGHAWLEVPLSAIPPKVLKNISQFSYMNGNKAYLEEDCDAGLFLEAVGTEINSSEIEDVVYPLQSIIRTYQSFRIPRYIR